MHAGGQIPKAAERARLPARLFAAAIGITVLGGLYAGLHFIGLPLPPFACDTELLERVRDESGVYVDADIEFCSAFAKEIFIHVYIAKDHTIPRTLVFSYDPETEKNPKISIVSKNRISIAVQDIANLFYQASYSNGYYIDYHIDKIYEP